MICINRRCQKEIEDGFAFCPHCGKSQTPAPKLRGKRPNGSGTVYKLSDGKRTRPWVVARGGKPLSYHATKAEAFVALDKIAGKQVSDKINYTFEDVFQAWFAEHSPQITPIAAGVYKTAYNWCAPLYKKKFRTLRVGDYNEIIATMASSGKARGTMDKVKQLAGQLYKWAIREDICDKNYAPFIALPSEERKEKKTFSDEQIAMLEADGSETARIVLMLIYTGVRINELFSATLENYHGAFFVTGSKSDSGKNRIVPIPNVARPHFEYFASCAKTKLLDGYKGRHTEKNFRTYDFTPLMQRLGFEGITPHCARHTFATKAVSRNMRPEALQKILGHATYSTTVEYYVHSRKDELISAAEDLWEKPDEC